MRGLIGDRLLKRFFERVVRQPDIDPSLVLDPKVGDGEGAPQEFYDAKLEKARGKWELEESEVPDTIIRSSDPLINI